MENKLWHMKSVLMVNGDESNYQMEDQVGSQATLLNDFKQFHSRRLTTRLERTVERSWWCCKDCLQLLSRSVRHREVGWSLRYLCGSKALDYSQTVIAADGRSIVTIQN